MSQNIMNIVVCKLHLQELTGESLEYITTKGNNVRFDVILTLV